MINRLTDESAIKRAEPRLLPRTYISADKQHAPLEILLHYGGRMSAHRLRFWERKEKRVRNFSPFLPFYLSNYTLPPPLGESSACMHCCRCDEKGRPRAKPVITYSLLFELLLLEVLVPYSRSVDASADFRKVHFWRRLDTIKDCQ